MADLPSGQPDDVIITLRPVAGGANTIRVANVPANVAAVACTRPVPPIADSRSHHNRLGTAPTPSIRAHIPARMSPAVREGIIVAETNRENASVITSTGNWACCPLPSGIGVFGNHRSVTWRLPGPTLWSWMTRSIVFRINSAALGISIPLRRILVG